jgi:hypoxanthine phosphoribosyltransferase
MSEVGELLSEEAVARLVDDLAARLAPRLPEDAVAVCLLTGGLWFAADLTRALFRRGRDLDFDALWIASYGDGRRTSGAVEVRAGLQRPVKDRAVLLIDDVLDTGLSLQEAARLLQAAGAREVLTCVFARKPKGAVRHGECDYAAWEAPDRYLAGYGMDLAGASRGRPNIIALD